MSSDFNVSPQNPTRCASFQLASQFTLMSTTCISLHHLPAPPPATLTQQWVGGFSSRRTAPLPGEGCTTLLGAGVRPSLFTPTWGCGEPQLWLQSAALGIPVTLPPAQRTQALSPSRGALFTSGERSLSPWIRVYLLPSGWARPPLQFHEFED